MKKATENSPFPMYPRGSLAYWWQRLGALMGAVALGYTAWAAYSAPPCAQSGKLLVLAVLWGVWPPFWWWTEFFFIYPEHHTKEKLEVLKHAAQASLAIWAPIAVALAAYSTSDYFKVPEPGKACSYVARGL